MIEKSSVFQTMLELNQSVQKFYHQLQQLPDSKEALMENWADVEIQLEEVEALIQRLSGLDPLNEQAFEPSDWERWVQLKTMTQALHAQSLNELMIKKERFYQEVQSVGQSVKVHQAYNEMKRIRF